jgi:hypothetical protein
VSELIVTLEHLHTVPNFRGGIGLCHSGSRAWMATHGLDWLAFVREGIPASQLEATGDAIVLNLVEHARAMEASRGR